MSLSISRSTGRVPEQRHIPRSALTSTTARTLQALGGAKVVLASVSQPVAMTAAVDGPRARGELIAIGLSPEKIEVSPVQLINGQKTLCGRATGTAREVEETMRFAAQSGVRRLWSGNGRASACPEGKGRR
jgi:D-arabinose 1-dehydrogenase-like Zn-dependent alcohol dehydrogenase